MTKVGAVSMPSAKSGTGVGGIKARENEWETTDFLKSRGKMIF